MVGRPTKYDWADLFASMPKSLMQGRDFPADVSGLAFQKQAQAAARKAGVALRTRTLVHDGKDWVRLEPRVDDRPARRRTYDWERIFGSVEPVVLVRGKDFDVPTATMRITALQAAERHGKTIKTKVRGSKLRIVTTPTIETQPATEMAPETKE